MWDNQRICQPADHISSLPDDTLCDILSFVPTKTAVKTSVLSKRWKYVWTKVPILDFTEFRDGSGIFAYYKFLTLEQRTLFNSFVDRVLTDNVVSNVQTLRLHLNGDHYFHINSWLHALTKRDIRDIDISLMDILMVPKPIELPRTFLCSERLVSLKLEGRFTIKFPVPLRLPNLETLWLMYLLLPNGDFFKTLSSSCPVIKDLQIVDTGLINTTIYVESLTMLRLTISKPRAPFVIRAPNLRYLYLRVTKLIKQNFTFVGELKLLDGVNIVILSFVDVEDVRELVRTVCMVPTLRFVAYRLYEYDINLPIFRNLTSFSIGCEKNMLLLLEHAPNLKILDIEFVDRDLEVVWLLESILSKPVPKCIPNLERVQIGGFCETDVHVQLVSYFLKFASVLKEMKLTLCPYEPSNWEEEAVNNILKKVLALPRTSATCQITIDE